MRKLAAAAVLALLAAGLLTGTAAAHTNTSPLPKPPTAQEIRMPAWDTVEARTAGGALIGAGLGALAGLPFFGIGALPGALIGGGLGALIGFASWQMANTYLGNN